MQRTRDRSDCRSKERGEGGEGGGTALLQMRAHLRLMRHLGSDEENDDDDIYGGGGTAAVPRRSAKGLNRPIAPTFPD